MRIFLTILVLTAGAMPAHAYDLERAGMKVTVEPIVGFDWSRRTDPSPHLHGHAVYGARARGGMPLLSLELEYTHGTDQEDFINPVSQTRDTDEKLKAGLVTGYATGDVASIQARGGLQATKSRHEITQGGVTSVTSPGIHWDPYLGGGGSIKLGDKLSLTASLTVVFVDTVHLSRNEYQTAFGLAIHVP